MASPVSLPRNLLTTVYPHSTLHVSLNPESTVCCSKLMFQSRIPALARPRRLLRRSTPGSRANQRERRPLQPRRPSRLQRNHRHHPLGERTRQYPVPERDLQDACLAKALPDCYIPWHILLHRWKHHRFLLPRRRAHYSGYHGHTPAAKSERSAQRMVSPLRHRRHVPRSCLGPETYSHYLASAAYNMPVHHRRSLENVRR